MEKLQEVFKAKGWGSGELWWGLESKAPGKFCDLTVKDPLICLFFNRCEHKKQRTRRLQWL